MSFFTRFRGLSAQGRTTAEDHRTTDGAPERIPGDDVAGIRDDGAGGDDRTAKHPVVARVTTVLAGLLVFFALVAPNQVGRLTPGAFVRIPVEALLGVALLLALAARARRVVAAIIGVVLGLLTILKFVDMGFYEALGRSFDPVLDWSLLDDAVGTLGRSTGWFAAVAAAV
ncbi:MAG: hypothetical protein JWP76_2273, partial [Dactylosporangium sp.]|nr:hypothetical protein [Dactylosporangium sp.]